MTIDLNKLSTEKINPETKDIDKLSTLEMVKLINNEDKKVAYAVESQVENIAKAIDEISERLYHGGRLIYIGAGTSGRLGILDASECPPTFGVDHELVQGLIAGGEKAIHIAVEGAEDSKELSVEDLKSINFSSKDALVGITASGRTPYVIGGAEYAKSLGAITIGVTNNKDSELGQVVHIPIDVEVGGEVITGSTRMKSGTAQKMILNTLSTGSMIKLGKVYGNLMVDVESTNLKLKERSKRIIKEATGVDDKEAIESLEKADGSVKLAIFMILSGLDKDQAHKILKENRGYIRKALEAIK